MSDQLYVSDANADEDFQAQAEACDKLVTLLLGRIKEERPDEVAATLSGAMTALVRHFANERDPNALIYPRLIIVALTPLLHQSAERYCAVLNSPPVGKA